jgi:hypothetical protein
MHCARVSLVLALLLPLAITSTTSAQAAIDRPTCLRIDRAAFGWSTWRIGERTAESGLTDVLVLDTAVHTTEFQRDRGGRLIRPHLPGPTPSDSHTGMYLFFNYWRGLPGDSILFTWYNGLHGPEFRMKLDGDTLRGIMVMRTDVVVVGGKPPQPFPASATRIRCS